jgi:hypothetical protein
MTAANYVDLILNVDLQEFYTNVQEDYCKPPIIIGDNPTCQTAEICRASSSEVSFLFYILLLKLLTLTSPPITHWSEMLFRRRMKWSEDEM